MKQVSDYIKLYTDIVDPKLCNDMINYEFEYDIEKANSDLYTKDIKKLLEAADIPDSLKQQMNPVYTEDYWIKEKTKFYEELKKSYQKSYVIYKKDFPMFNVNILTDFRISKYNKSCSLNNHIDTIAGSHGQQFGHPQVTVLLFLNDDYEGGEIVIADNIYKPPAGSAILFPSNFMYPHEVLLIKEGTRYSVTCWLM